jgi:hypothetical protein
MRTTKAEGRGTRQKGHVGDRRMPCSFSEQADNHISKQGRQKACEQVGRGRRRLPSSKQMPHVVVAVVVAGVILVRFCVTSRKMRSRIAGINLSKGQARLNLSVDFVD